MRHFCVAMADLASSHIDPMISTKGRFKKCLLTTLPALLCPIASLNAENWRQLFRRSRFDAESTAASTLELNCTFVNFPWQQISSCRFCEFRVMLLSVKKGLGENCVSNANSASIYSY